MATARSVSTLSSAAERASRRLSRARPTASQVRPSSGMRVMTSSLVRMRTLRNLCRRSFMAFSLPMLKTWLLRRGGAGRGPSGKAMETDGGEDSSRGRIGVLEAVDGGEDRVGVEDRDGQTAALADLEKACHRRMLGVAGLGGAEDALAPRDDHLHAADEQADEHRFGPQDQRVQRTTGACLVAHGRLRQGEHPGG